MQIRKRKNRGGSVSYQLDMGAVDGKRLRRSFETRQEAETARSNALAARKTTGQRGIAALSSSELVSLMAAQQRLASHGVTVDQAVEYYLQHALQVRERVLVPELVKRFIAEKESVGRSKRTLQTMRVTLPSLARAVPTKAVEDVTRDDVKAWLRGNGWSARTQNNRRAEVRTLFRWAIAEKLAKEDPCEGLPKISSGGEEEIETLVFADCVRLLTLSRGTAFAGYVALGLFCGLRRAELERLRWDRVDLEGKTVIVTGTQAKTRRRRVVDIPDNGVLWLKAALQEDERLQPSSALKRIVPANFKDDWIEWRRANGYKHWPHNALRHTYASYHYAMHQDESRLQAQMGHVDSDELFRSYRALKTKAEAEKFWKLVPKK